MANVKTRLSSVVKGTALDAFAPLFNPTTAANMAIASANVAKTQQDIEALQRKNAQANAFRDAIARGAPIGELQALAGADPELQGKLSEIHRLRVFTNPNSTQAEKDAAARATGVAYGSTQEGTQFVQGQENVRSRIAAGPGYASAAAARYGHDLSYKAQQERLRQDQQHWTDDPKPLFDPSSNMVTYQRQGDLVSMGPTPSVPYSPEAYKGANTLTPYSTEPNSTPVLGRASDLTQAFLSRANPPVIYAPTPPDVQVKKITPMEARAPGEQEPRLYPPDVVAAQPGVFSPPAKDTSGNTVSHEAITLGENAPIDAEQALRGLFNVAANRTDQGYLLDKNGKSVIDLPPEFAQRMPDLIARVQRYAQYNKGNMTAAAQQVFGEEFGDPGPQGGFTINRGWGVAPPAVTYGTRRQPLNLPATPENYPTPSPTQKTTRPPAAGPPVPPPAPTPATVLAPPPPPAPAYQPAGSAPLTISLGGNPAPAPAPAAPAAPAPAAAPAAKVPPRPAGSDAELVAQAQAAIKAGADPNAVMTRLRGWNIQLPP
jgi:hypothetical protein